MPKKKPRDRNVTERNIQRLRLEAEPKISQEDMLARLTRMGVDLKYQSQIAKIESGERPILDYELEAIAKILKVPITELFAGRR